MPQGGAAYLQTYSSVSPRILAKINISHLARNQISMQFATSSNSTLSPQNYYSPVSNNSKGVAYAFIGTTSEVQGTFYFDISNLVNTDYSQLLYYFIVNDSVSGSTLTINSFEVVDGLNGNILYSAPKFPQLIDASQFTFIVGDYTPDLLPPSTPSLSGSVVIKTKGKRVSLSSFGLSWSAANDNVGVSGYIIYKKGVKLAQKTSLSYNDTTGSSGVSYKFEV